MHIIRRVLRPSLLLTACVAFFLPAGAFTAQPNIVFIISDDHDNEHLGFMGNEMVHTPNLDRLADSGTVFTVAFSAGCGLTSQVFITTTGPRSLGRRIPFPAC